MAYVKVYVHLVWSTKNRYPFLKTEEIRKNVWKHIFENARGKGIIIDNINGFYDHCHCLVSLGSDQTIQKTIKLLKGESSFWINNNNICKEKFEWQDGYFAVSISESIVGKVRQYIQNQEEHHQHWTYKQECDDINSKYGFNINNDK